MRVTFLSPPLNLSGGNRVVAIYSEFLKAAGHEVMVVAQPHASLGAVSRALGRFGLPRPARVPQLASHQALLDVPMRVLQSYRPIRAADVPDADVIVATWWETAEWASRMPPSKGKQSYFVQHHEVFDFMPEQRVRATYRLPIQKIVVAPWLATLIEREYGDPNCIVVPNAIDPAQFFAKPRGKQARPTIGTLFHETAFKAFDTTLAVLRRIREQLPDVRVLAFGASPPETYAGQMDGIELVLAPPQDRIREIYSSCDVWLSCSRSEGFNLTAMEAMACRTPVVSTRTGWPEEAIHAGLNGALAEVDDVEALAHATLSILALPEPAWRALSDGAAATVADSSWEASSRMFEQALLKNLDPSS